MHNSGPYRSLEQFNDDEKFFNENFTSVIDGDYVLNYLNEGDLTQRPMQISSGYGQGLPEMHSYPSFTDTHKAMEALQGRNGRIETQDSWQMANATGNKKGQQSASSYKMESPDDFDGNAKMKKIKTNREIEMKVSPENQSKMKNNIKNTYINKINSLITEEKPDRKKNGKGQDAGKKGGNVKNEIDERGDLVLSRTGVKKPRPCDVLQPDELEKLDIKLAKNRESARNSRIRKKVYIDLLEKTVDKLQKELAETRKQLEVYTTNANKISFESKPVNNLFQAKQQLYDRLEKMVNTKADESEINFLIDSLRLRFGSSGKERIEAVNFMFKQVLEFLVPVHMKYILSVASEDKDMFAIIEDVNHQIHQLQTPELASPAGAVNTEYWKELGLQVNLSENQKKNMIKYKKKLLVEKQKFEGIIITLNQVRKSVLKQANSLQAVVDEFRGFLSGRQMARLLLSLEKENNKKVFSAEKLWAAVTRKESHDEDSEVSDCFLDPAEGEDDEDTGEKGQRDESDTSPMQ